MLSHRSHLSKQDVQATQGTFTSRTEKRYFTWEVNSQIIQVRGEQASLTTETQGHTLLVLERFYTTARQGELLTHGDQVAVGFQHHVPVQGPLRGVQLLPLLTGEANSHVAE